LAFFCNRLSLFSTLSGLFCKNRGVGYPDNTATRF
jgi:hypothetical protein